MALSGENHRTGAIKTKENAEKLSTDAAFLVPFCDGPAPISPEAVGKNIFLNTIHSANRYVYITTPYLIIDYEMTEALKGAVGRGVDVRIITPAVADKRIVKIMTKNSYSYLTKAGVRIFEYSPGFIHEKLLVADGESAIVGTINLDYRSLVHHFEDGVFVFGKDTVSAMRDGFLDTQSKSHEILPKNARLRFHERIIRDLIRIFAPLM
jgi:cardiolipin synthase